MVRHPDTPVRQRSRADGVRTPGPVLFVVALSVALFLVPAGAPAASPPSGVAPPETAPGSAAPALRQALDAGDLEGYAARIDDLLWEDAVASLAAGDVPPRPPLPLDVLRGSLGTGTALVAFCPIGDSVFALVVNQEGLAGRELDAPQTGVMSARLQRWAAEPSAHPYDPHAASMLYNGLFPPLRSELAGVRHLVLAVSGPLAGLPFEAFLTYPSDDGDPGARMYLGRAAEVSYEATLGSRVGWSPRRGGLRRVPPPDPAAPADFGDSPLEPGAWVLAAGVPEASARVVSLRLLRAGARGALLAPSAAALDAVFPAIARESSGGRRPDAIAMRRVRMAAMGAGEPPEYWALVSHWGSR